MRSLLSCLITAILLLATLGCNAQSTGTPEGKPLTTEQKQHLETVLRARYAKVPQEAAFSFGERQPSQFAGYDLLPVTLSNKGKSSMHEFLVSADGSHLMPLNAKPTDQLLMSKDGKQFMILDKLDFSVANRPVRGNPEAKVTIVSYDDFQCPYCAEMHKTLSGDIPRIYGDKVKVVYKDFPLDQIHPWAVHAEVDANCLSAQSNDAYWGFGDFVHANQQGITRDEKGEKRPVAAQLKKLDDIALDQGSKHKLDAEKLSACVKKQDESEVRASMKEGDALGVEATPTLFINGERMEGLVPLEALRAVIDHALQAQGVTPPTPSPAEATPAEPAKTEKKPGA